MTDSMTRRAANPVHLAEVRRLLSRHRLVEDLVHRQEMARHELVEDLLHKQNLVELQRFLGRRDVAEVAAIIESLDEHERLLVWNEIDEDIGDSVLALVADDIRLVLVSSRYFKGRKNMLNAFELRNGRLRQVQVENREDLASLKPIWVDLVAPSDEVRAWVGEHFAIELPDPADLTDLEASARFYVEDNGEVHLHSDFLLDLETQSRNVPVAFILHQDILFSVRTEELPVFRLQRMRARTQPGYVSDGKDVLLDLYSADGEYSADALEDVYAALETVSKMVLNQVITDQEAAKILSEIAKQEDLNGRIRRNVHDTRRAVSFLLRGKFLNLEQQEDARQIMRDIESLDGHTSFLFGKINFLMDATVGFININQNQRVSKLTAISIIFMPLNILAGIGGMSEYSMMTEGIPWPIAYTGFVLGSAVIGWATYHLLKYFEARQARQAIADKLRLGTI
jgi:magnesium transporter